MPREEEDDRERRDRGARRALSSGRRRRRRRTARAARRRSRPIPRTRRAPRRSAPRTACRRAPRPPTSRNTDSSRARRPRGAERRTADRRPSIAVRPSIARAARAEGTRTTASWEARDRGRAGGEPMVERRLRREVPPPYAMIQSPCAQHVPHAERFARLAARRDPRRRPTRRQCSPTTAIARASCVLAPELAAPANLTTSRSVHDDSYTNVRDVPAMPACMVEDRSVASLRACASSWSKTIARSAKRSSTASATRVSPIDAVESGEQAVQRLGADAYDMMILDLGPAGRRRPRPVARDPAAGAVARPRSSPRAARSRIASRGSTPARTTTSRSPSRSSSSSRASARSSAAATAWCRRFSASPISSSTPSLRVHARRTVIVPHREAIRHPRTPDAPRGRARRRGRRSSRAAGTRATTACRT